MTREPAGSQPVLTAVAVIYAVVEVSQVGAVATEHGLPSPWLVTQVLALAALVLAVPHLRLAWSPVLTGALLVVGAQLVSAPTARDQQAALEAALGTAKDTLTLVVTFVLLLATGRHRLVIAACTGALALLAGLAVVQEVVLGNRSDFGGLATAVDPGVAGAATLRHAGPVGDPNFWARVLVLFLPFAVALALVASSRRRQIAWGLASLSLLGGTWLTQSRGGMLAAAAAVVTLFLVAGPRYRRWLLVVPPALIVIVTVPATGSRLATLTDAGGPSGDVDESLLLRERAQETALRMVADHPVLGVGAGNYEAAAVRVERDIDVEQLGRIEQGVAPHNAFLAAAAETGLPGLAMWLVLLGAVGFAALRGLLLTRPPPGETATPDRLLAAACLAGLVGWMMASTVLHVEQYRTLLVFAGITAAFDVTLAQATVERPRVVVARARNRRWASAAATAAFVALLAVVAMRSTTRQWQAEGFVTVVAREPSASTLGAYEYEILSRPGVMRSLGLVVGDPARVREAVVAAGSEPEAVTVEVETRKTSTVMRVLVAGADRDEILAVLQTIRSQGVLAINRFDLPFVASATGEASAGEVTEAKTDRIIVVLAGAAFVTWALVVIRRGDRRVPTPVASGPSPR